MRSYCSSRSSAELTCAVAAAHSSSIGVSRVRAEDWGGRVPLGPAATPTKASHIDMVATRAAYPAPLGSASGPSCRARLRGAA